MILAKSSLFLQNLVNLSSCWAREGQNFRSDIGPLALSTLRNSDYNIVMGNSLLTMAIYENVASSASQIVAMPSDGGNCIGTVTAGWTSGLLWLVIVVDCICATPYVPITPGITITPSILYYTGTSAISTLNRRVTIQTSNISLFANTGAVSDFAMAFLL